MQWFDWVAFVLIILGALNWGFVAWFDWNLVTAIFQASAVMVTIVYSLVAIAGIYGLFAFVKLAKK